ncbi:uncharacterized protein LOC128547948 [Mercenaria mercenaria]|uniref:uncharacterized protein LOC128547948 n=1 Tax=Mercenaria mercenaria TaxID=6596 RepID=UPI00234E59DA|nr:uncharacterized protein LOC128547948 [Mercenaria mercenaria]
MTTMELTEYSDHCPIAYNIMCQKTAFSNSREHIKFDKIYWDSGRSMDLLASLEENREVFDRLTNNIVNDNENIDSNIERLSETIYQNCFKIFGKSVNYKPNKIKKRNEWFNDDCRRAKNLFLDNKRKVKRCGNSENIVEFLQSRKYYCDVKRKAKYNFFAKEKRNISELSRKSPKMFWKKINKYRNSSKTSNPDVEVSLFRNHFSKILNTPVESSFISDNVQIINERDRSVDIDCLDKPFDVQEIFSRFRLA